MEETMSRDHTQEALDEYYTTGIDPSGGEIGPDFNPETGEYQDELDETEQTFYSEQSEFDAGIERLERLVDQKIAEVDAYAKRLQAQEEEPAPAPAPKKFSWAGLIWEIAIIGFLIFMLIMLLK